MYYIDSLRIADAVPEAIASCYEEGILVIQNSACDLRLCCEASWPFQVKIPETPASQCDTGSYSQGAWRYCYTR